MKRTKAEPQHLPGAGEAVTEMYPVPPNYRTHLKDAEFACMHIAEKGTVVSVGNISLNGVQFAVCEECHGNVQTKGAKAGK